MYESMHKHIAAKGIGGGHASPRPHSRCTTGYQASPLLLGLRYIVLWPFWGTYTVNSTSILPVILAWQNLA